MTTNPEHQDYLDRREHERQLHEGSLPVRSTGACSPEDRSRISDWLSGGMAQSISFGASDDEEETRDEEDGRAIVATPYGTSA